MLATSFITWWTLEAPQEIIFLWARPQVRGFQKYGDLFPGKKRLRQRTHKLKASRNFAPLGFRPKKQGFRTAWLITGQKFPWKKLKSGSSLLTFRDLQSHISQIIMRMARWGDLHFKKISDFFWPGCEIFLSKKYEIWFEMGPYGSVGAHIRALWPKIILKPLLTQKGHGMTKKKHKKV